MNNAFYKRETFLNIKRYKLMSLKMFVLCFICALIKTFTFSFGMSLKHDMGEIIDNKMSLCKNTVILDGNSAEKIISSLNEEYMLTSELAMENFTEKA